MLCPNRQRITLTRVLGENINRETVLKTNGHPSYPWAAEDLLVHIAVNHSEYYINNNSDHINNFVILCSHL